jgi:hypothetical protein
MYSYEYICDGGGLVLIARAFASVCSISLISLITTPSFPHLISAFLILDQPRQGSGTRCIAEEDVHGCGTRT